MSLVSDILAECRKMINSALERVGIAPSGQWELPTTSLPSGGDTGLGFTPAPHDHEGLYDARSIWGRTITPTTPADGQVYVWDEAANVWSLGAGGGGGSGSAFRAHVISEYELTPTHTKLNAEDEQYDLGEFYDATTSSWTPPAGPVAFMYRIRIDDNIQPYITIRKNGSDIYAIDGGRYSLEGDALTESYFMDAANGTDVYQLWLSGTGAGSTTIRAGDTFWAGMSGGGGGGGGGTGGGGVPAPYYYLTDSDGLYLLDSDGRYLYESA